MTEFVDYESTSWTATDLVARFGPIPLSRVCSAPAPGTATEWHVMELHDRTGRLYELVDGTLVAKTMGTYESFLAAKIVHVLISFVANRKLGIVLGADGMLRLAPGLIRIPDVSFISHGRLPDGKLPNEGIAGIVPDLAVEVISPSNTREEMEGKLVEYFRTGVRLVWYVYPRTRSARVYASAEQYVEIHEHQQLDGGEVLPSFSMELKDLFAEPF